MSWRSLTVVVAAGLSWAALNILIAELVAQYPSELYGLLVPGCVVLAMGWGFGALQGTAIVKDIKAGAVSSRPSLSYWEGQRQWIERVVAMSKWWNMILLPAGAAVMFGTFMQSWKVVPFGLAGGFSIWLYAWQVSLAVRRAGRLPPEPPT